MRMDLALMRTKSMFQRAFSKHLLFVSLLTVTSATTQASASLPHQQLNLTMLDLNGSPFRYFHLSNYSGDILNNRHIPNTKEPLKQIINFEKVRPEQMHQITGLKLPKLSYTPVEQEITRNLTDHIDEGLIQQWQQLPY